MISVQRLEGFYWVARTQGYARAARAFPYPITEPGVHQQVKRLESELGAKLLERVGKDRVVPTAAGLALYELVAPFFERLPQVVAEIRGGSVGGRIRIGAGALVLRHLLPGWLKRLQAKRSDIEVALTETRTDDPAPLLAGELDLLIGHQPSPSDRLEAVEVAEAFAFLVLPARHPLAERARMRLADLAQEPFIAFHADQALRSLQLRAFEEAGVSARISHAADSTETILAMVAAGVGFSLVPSLSERGPGQAQVVAHRMGQGLRFPLHALRRRGYANPLVQAFLDLGPHG